MIFGAEIPTWIGEVAFGSVVLLAVAGLIWFKPAVDQLIKRTERAEQQRDELLATYQTEILPALREGTALGGKMLVVVEEQRELLIEVRTLMRGRGKGS